MSLCTKLVRRCAGLLASRGSLASNYEYPFFHSRASKSSAQVSTWTKLEARGPSSTTGSSQASGHRRQRRGAPVRARFHAPRVARCSVFGCRMSVEPSVDHLMRCGASFTFIIFRVGVCVESGLSTDCGSPYGPGTAHRTGRLT